MKNEKRKPLIRHFNVALPDLVSRCPLCERLFSADALVWTNGFWTWKMNPGGKDEPTWHEPAFRCRDCSDENNTDEYSSPVKSEHSLLDELVRRGLRADNCEVCSLPTGFAETHCASGGEDDHAG